MNWKPLPVAGFFDRQQRTTFTANDVQWVSDRITLARADICTAAARRADPGEAGGATALLDNLAHIHATLTEYPDPRAAEYVEIGTAHLRIQHDPRLWESWIKTARPELSFNDGLPVVSWWRDESIVGLTAVRRFGWQR